jgi:type III secretion protein J
MGSSWRIRLLLPALVLLLCGCDRVDLYTSLSEQQANEVAAVLLAAQIETDKRPGEGKSWSVRIAKADLPRAMDVLETAGQPRLPGQSMAEIFKKDGFISSPLEERARFIAATQTELQTTLARMNGVVDARVHLAMPERDPLTDAVVPPSAAVFVKYGQNVKFAESGGIADVKALVRDAVEGLSVERITVVAVPATGPWRHTVRPSPSALAEYAYQRPMVPAWLAGLIAVLLAAGLGAAAWWTRERWLPALRLPSSRTPRKAG